MSYCNTSSILEEEDHAVSLKLRPLDASLLSARAWNLGPQTGEEPPAGWRLKTWT
jgi:hypothetical protein